MIRAGVAAAIAVLFSLSAPAEACWKRDGVGWRSAGASYGYRDGWGYRSHRPWIGAGFGWRGDGWRHRRHWRGDGYGYRSGVAVGVRTGDRWDRGYGWRSDRTERRGLFRERRMDADVVTK